MGTNRRRFLQTAGSAVVFQLAGSGPKIRAAGPNETVSLGFIGSGIRATQLIDEFKRVPGVKFPAVCDLYDGCLQRSREQIAADIATTKDYRAVLDRKDVDAVVIATPDHLHKSMVLDALAAGKHVYVEKPLTWSLEEGPEIIRAANESGRIVQVGSQGKTSALTAKAREIVKSGALGKVNMIRLANHRNNAQGAWRYAVPPDASPKTIDWKRFLGDKPERPFNPEIFFRWRCWWEFSGGVATDLFVHLLTWLHEVMDVKAPVSVVSQGGLWRWKDGRDVPDVMNSIFEYEEGFIADMYVNLCNGKDLMGPAIYGTEGTLVQERGKLILYKEPVDHDVQQYGTLSWPRSTRGSYFESKGYTAQGRPTKAQPPTPEPEEMGVERGPTHEALFILSIRNGESSRETAEEGHYAAGAAHVANLAYRQGKRMKWDWKTNTASA
jgi:predicted dehydrogenase